MLEKVFKSFSPELLKVLTLNFGMAPDRAGLITNFLLLKIISAFSNSSKGNISQNDLMDMIGKASGGSLVVRWSIS